jgi:glycosyltransferase involved in cell wall biosynthesis
MKIGILGSRGIPNRYGGFEEFASHLSPGLVALGAEVWVYCSSSHPYRKSEWQGVHLIHCYDPDDQIGTAGQFLYDLNCILDSRRRNYDILFQLGYTSSSVWKHLLPAGPVIVTNMDGLEWKRNKYNKVVKHFLKYAEKLAVGSSDRLVADSQAIAGYLRKKYGRHAEYLSYGADIPAQPESGLLSVFNISPHNYHLVIARLQPDNHIEEIIRGVIDSKCNQPLIVVGNTKNAFGKYLKKRYHTDKIRFAGSIFDKELLQTLAFYSLVYFHGHSAGGTNPSLLEAMAASAFICAHENQFNKEVLEGNAVYFKNHVEISDFLNDFQNKDYNHTFIKNNLKRIAQYYNWQKIINDYFDFFQSL